MCFSATASFAIAGVLTPIAAYTVHAAQRHDPRWLGMAAFPAAFGLQQAIEGVVWLGLAAEADQIVAIAGRGFLFFSHFFWLAFVPFAVRLIEDNPARRRLLSVLTLAGTVFGLSIVVPALIWRDWLTIAITDGSIDYQTRLIYDGLVGRTPLRVVYALIILGALFASTHREILRFAALILASVLVTTVVWPAVFISVWCFFAAALSAWLAGEMAVRWREGAVPS